LKVVVVVTHEMQLWLLYNIDGDLEKTLGTHALIAFQTDDVLEATIQWTIKWPLRIAPYGPLCPLCYQTGIVKKHNIVV